MPPQTSQDSPCIDTWFTFVPNSHYLKIRILHGNRRILRPDPDTHPFHLQSYHRSSQDVPGRVPKQSPAPQKLQLGFWFLFGLVQLRILQLRLEQQCRRSEADIRWSSGPCFGKGDATRVRPGRVHHRSESQVL